MHDTELQHAHHDAARSPETPCIARRLRALLMIVGWLLGGSALAEETPTPGAGMLMLSDGDRWHEALLLDTRLELVVSGLLADLRLTQTFTNQSEHWLDGRYLMPLPASASVHTLQLRIGERHIEGHVLPRDEAAATYREARDAGQLTSLVEQQRPNLYTVRLSNIAPGETVQVAMGVDLPVDQQDGRYSLTIPTTLTPRYHNAAVSDADAITSPQAAATVIRGPHMSLDLRLEPGDAAATLASRSHHLLLTDTGARLENVPMDRDLLLDWRLPGGAAPGNDAFLAERDGERFLQMMVTPPEHIDAAAISPRELVLVVDTSGSMAGESMRAARQALLFALDGLRADDTVNIIRFSDHTTSLFDAARIADDATLRAARHYVRSLTADGGTEMEPALLTALRTQAFDEAGPDRLRQVVFITDGSVGYEDTLLRTVRRELGANRLFTIGIGSAPNRWFLDKMAEAGRGFALSIAETSQAGDAMRTLFRRLQTPVLTDISWQLTGGRGELYPAQPADLYAGSPLQLSARVDASVSAIAVHGYRNGEPWQQTIALDGQRQSLAADAIARLWASRRIEDLLDAQRHASDTDRHREEITALAMRMHIASPYTSFVAVDQPRRRAAGDPLLGHDVPNLLPAGSDMQTITLPVGAAGLDTLLWAGCLCLLLAMLSAGGARRLHTR